MLLQGGALLTWKRGPKKLPLHINARSEDITDKPTFAESFEARWYLIPAEGFSLVSKATNEGRNASWQCPSSFYFFRFATGFTDFAFAAFVEEVFAFLDFAAGVFETIFLVTASLTFFEIAFP